MKSIETRLAALERRLMPPPLGIVVTLYPLGTPLRVMEDHLRKALADGWRVVNLTPVKL